MRERQRIRIASMWQRAERGLVHQGADREVRQKKAPRFLPDQLGRFAAEHALGATQMGLEFVECSLDFPALVIERREFVGGRPGRLEDVGDEAIRGVCAGRARERVRDDPHRDRCPVAALAPRIPAEFTPVRPVGPALQNRQRERRAGPPDEGRAGGARRTPEIEPEQATIGKAQHRARERREHGRR